MVLVAEELASTADARWCLDQYAANLERLFPEGFDQSRGNRLEPDDVLPPHGHFVIARLGGRPVGCGALKVHTDALGEVKRMFTDPAVRGQRVGTTLLQAIVALAREKDVSQLMLETGVGPGFEGAHRLYTRYGFTPRGAFLDYPESQWSAFYEITLVTPVGVA